MFDWLGRWFGNFVGAVGNDVVNLVHWAVRAVADWAGRIFKAVGGAWNDIYKAAGEELAGLEHFAYRVFRHLEAILKHDFPGLWRFVNGLVNWARKEFFRIWHWIYREVKRLYETIAHNVKALTTWVQRDIWDPLKRFADQLWHDLIKWGYFSWYLITHPGKLAALLFWALVQLLEVNAWSAAKLLGEFVTALFLNNIRRIALLLEDILYAVL